MKHVLLGDTGIKVSELCFGTLVIGPLQKSMDIDKGADIIIDAMEKGINFIDTAQLYKTYGYISQAIKKSGMKPVIATKSYAYDTKGAEESFMQAIKELAVDHIDVFLLHEQESEHTIRGHTDALAYYTKRKEAGDIRAVGISAHSVDAVFAAARMPGIDVIHPMLNYKGLGIINGDRDDMEAAIKLAHQNGKGIYTMKAFGGGNLLCEYKKAIDYIKGFEYSHSTAIGMQSTEETDMNIAAFSDNKPAVNEVLSNKRLHIDYWCTGCGNCVKACAQQALSIVDNKALADKTKCVLCGYCSAYCPQFAIKIC